MIRAYSWGILILSHFHVDIKPLCFVLPLFYIAIPNSQTTSNRKFKCLHNMALSVSTIAFQAYAEHEIRARHLSYIKVSLVKQILGNKHRRFGIRVIMEIFVMLNLESTLLNLRDNFIYVSINMRSLTEYTYVLKMN